MGMEWRQVRITQYQKGRVLEEEAGGKILRKGKGLSILSCAFCRGKGVGYHGGGTCYVCGGRGEIRLFEPILECVFCGGTGRAERATETSCVVCNGKGAFSVTKPYGPCPDCKGKGRGTGPRHKLPCLRCSGKGIVRGREMEEY